MVFSIILSKVKSFKKRILIKCLCLYVLQFLTCVAGLKINHDHKVLYSSMYHVQKKISLVVSRTLNYFDEQFSFIGASDFVNHINIYLSDDLGNTNLYFIFDPVIFV